MQSTPQPLPEDPVILHGIISHLSDQLAESERERCAQASALEQQTSTLEQHVQRIDQLLEDIELLRRHLGIARWRVTGGSWGATLALAYAAAAPLATSGLVLRSTFMPGAANAESRKLWRAHVRPY